MSERCGGKERIQASNDGNILKIMLIGQVGVFKLIQRV